MNKETDIEESKDHDVGTLTDIIDETPDYKVQLEVFKDYYKNTYKIINKPYNVVEISLSILPRVLQAMNELQKELDIYRKAKQKQSKQVISQISPNKKLN